MPSLGESLGLGALTSWLSRPSQADKDRVDSSGEPEDAKPKTKQTTTTWSEMAEGRTFEQAMAAVMAAMPASSTDSEKADELADALEVTRLSENIFPEAGTDAQFRIKQDNADVTKENVLTETMQAAVALEPGSTEYYDAISHVYDLHPRQKARRSFLKRLIQKVQKQDWIPFEAEKEGGVKAVDYGAGTGSLSHALAPYVTEILAIDKSAKMVEEYNKIAAKENKTKCEMKAVQGDMTTHFLSGKRVGIEEPQGVSAGFDLVAMCLAVDFFTHEDVDEDSKQEELVRSLDVMINLLQANGILLIIDVEKCDEECYQDAAYDSPSFAHEGLKSTGHGSRDLVKALEELGMEDAAVLGNQEFLVDVKPGSGSDSPESKEKEIYFALKAKRGAMFEERLAQR